MRTIVVALLAVAIAVLAFTTSAVVVARASVAILARRFIAGTGFEALFLIALGIVLLIAHVLVTSASRATRFGTHAGTRVVALGLGRGGQRHQGGRCNNGSTSSLEHNILSYGYSCPTAFTSGVQRI